MSDIGLHGSLYGEIRELAELVDLVISDIAVDGQDAISRRQLAERLTDMTAAGSRGLVMRYLGPTAALHNWGDLAEALRHEPVPAGITDRLETLARALDMRRSAALARLHGNGAR
jgi:hypothetical protein